MAISINISNGRLINHQSIAIDVGFAANTITENYQILQDTLLGFNLEPNMKSI
jgi:hypothetical protein